MWTPDPSQIITAEQKAAETAERKRAAINQERDRRVIAGITVEVAGYGPIPLQGRTQDKINMMALADTARDLKAANVTAAIIPFRDAADFEHSLTATQLLEANDKGKHWVSAVYQASWAIKAMDPIPDDVTDNTLWPSG